MQDYCRTHSSQCMQPDDKEGCRVMNEREVERLNILQSMGLRVYGDLGNVRLVDAFPSGSASPNEHFEFG